MSPIGEHRVKCHWCLNYFTCGDCIPQLCPACQEEENRLRGFVDNVAKNLDAEATEQFRRFERLELMRAMRTVGMADYPAPICDPNGRRASGDCLCRTCHQEYRDHPLDWRVIGYGGRPFLFVLCNGERVKL